MKTSCTRYKKHGLDHFSIDNSYCQGLLYHSSFDNQKSTFSFLFVSFLFCPSRVHHSTIVTRYSTFSSLGPPSLKLDHKGSSQAETLSAKECGQVGLI
jgi:hypothetical protein